MAFALMARSAKWHEDDRPFQTSKDNLMTEKKINKYAINKYIQLSTKSIFQH